MTRSGELLNASFKMRGGIRQNAAGMCRTYTVINPELLRHCKDDDCEKGDRNANAV
jgi:hypothetical protein